MDNVITLLGQIVGSGIAFIILFVVVEYIPPLKLVPRVKYSIPIVIGALFAISAALGATTHRGSPLIASIVAIALAIWYAVGSIQNARRSKGIAPKDAKLEKTDDTRRD
ncbi:MAG TPA: hypothetical protein VJB68_03380 [Methylophilaceae bacterium]|nr:hypothetical protein [Methylophilaceae bacterium]